MLTSSVSEKSEESNINNGLITKIWGEAGWTFNHSITFGYPVNPTDEQREFYRLYFSNLGNVLPCKYCRESYLRIITTGETTLDDSALKNRESLVKWFYNVHNEVNKKLDIEYCVTLEDVIEKYESFRAKCGTTVDKKAKGCVSPLDYKAFSFKKLYYSDAPIVSLNVAERIVRFAKLSGIDDKYFSFLEVARALHGNFDKLKLEPSWKYRNKLCRQKIKHMRKKAIPSIYPSGKYSGSFTPDELILLLHLSSNLNKQEVESAISISNNIT